MAPGSWVMRRLPFSTSTTPFQAAAYLLGISLFSISFLVFLNSSVSFVVTDLIGQRHGVGDVVGTLGFADELVALIACPVWGLASDRVGVRAVAVTGYAVIGLSLFLFVQARNVYPQLLLARILFAVGATATATMVTAILPSLTGEPGEDENSAGGRDDCDHNEAADGNGHHASGLPRKPTHNLRASIAPSVDSQLTITPERFQSLSNGGVDIRDLDGSGGSQPRDRSSALAGWVGLFTGCGALVALALFLPLPAYFASREGVTLGQAVSYSFYVVGAIALAAAVFVAFGLRNLRGEEGKGWRALLGLMSVSSASEDGHSSTQVMAPGPASKEAFLPYGRLLKDSVLLGFRDPNIGLGYLGGFVARASTVAISLFIPLFVNAFFIRSGFCQGSPTDPSPELKEECRAAYVLASILTGVAQLMGLIAAPVFGYLSGGGGRGHRGRVNVPVVVATVFGIVGYVAFPQLPSPEFTDAGSRGGSPVVFLFAALVGISQIGAIVCSLGSLGRGVLTAELPRVSHVPFNAWPSRETSPLLQAAGRSTTAQGQQTVSRVRLKGSIAGVYSWCGGAAILLLTKLGGHLFDVWSTGAPFYLMAVFNAVLLVAALGVDVGRWARERRPGHLDV